MNPLNPLNPLNLLNHSAMEQTSRIVTVEIHGQRYPIKSVLDAAYVADLAAYVDEKMRLALKECPSGDTLKIAVLAALNIADEYFRSGEEVRDRQVGFAHRARELERMLDLALASVGEQAAAG
jgi:cell division protein ZapA